MSFAAEDGLRTKARDQMWAFASVSPTGKCRAAKAQH